MVRASRWKRYLRIIGPGVITGASDDDPAGIATYSVAGASAGYAFLWLMPLMIPLMIAVQGMSARIGAVREEGLGHVIKDTFGPRWLGVAVVVLLIMNVSTIGADLAAAASALSLLTSLDLRSFVVPIGLGIILVEVFWSYRNFARYVRFLALVLLAYIPAAFLANPDWARVAGSTLIPRVVWDEGSLALIVAVIGTTISPYMFFWQASEEVEEIREKERHPSEETYPAAKSERWRLIDTTVGMSYSNLIAYFIILTSAATLHREGIMVHTSAEAARALRPIAGDYAFVLFAVGIIGAALLAIPVLAGASAYPASELFECPEGLDRPVHRARCFYGILAASIAAGMLIALLPINPIDVLFYTQVLMGLLAPVLLVMLLLIARNREIMGRENVNTPLTNVFGWAAVAILVLADLAMLWMVVT